MLRTEYIMNIASTVDIPDHSVHHWLYTYL